MQHDGQHLCDAEQAYCRDRSCLESRSEWLATLLEVSVATQQGLGVIHDLLNISNWVTTPEENTN